MRVRALCLFLVQDVLQIEREQLPVVGEEHRDQEAEERAAAGAPPPRDDVVPPEKVPQSLLDGAGQLEKEAESLGVARVALSDSQNVEDLGKQEKEVDKRVVEVEGKERKEVEIDSNEGVVGGPPVGVAEEMRQEVEQKRTEKEKEKENSEKVVVEDMAGGEEKATARELKALKRWS